jgi:transcription elongation factor GreA
MTTHLRTAHDDLRARLADLLAERSQVAEEAAIPSSGGDIADRSHNIDALIRLANIDRHIEDLEVQLQDSHLVDEPLTDAASVGSTVWLRFDGEADSEPYLIGFVEQARPEQNVITPNSPLGRAVLGARADQVVVYEGPKHRAVVVTVVKVER